jgi:hypothetical protein
MKKSKAIALTIRPFLIEFQYFKEAKNKKKVRL